MTRNGKSTSASRDWIIPSISVMAADVAQQGLAVISSRLLFAVICRQLFVGGHVLVLSLVVIC